MYCGGQVTVAPLLDVLPENASWLMVQAWESEAAAATVKLEVALKHWNTLVYQEVSCGSGGLALALLEWR